MKECSRYPQNLAAYVYSCGTLPPSTTAARHAAAISDPSTSANARATLAARVQIHRARAALSKGRRKKL